MLLMYLSGGGVRNQAQVRGALGHHAAPRHPISVLETQEEAEIHTRSVYDCLF